MNTHANDPTADARRLAQSLRDLGAVQAPPSILPSVLVRSGLADAYWRIKTTIGPMFVAVGPEGVSAVMPAHDAAAFERAFRERLGRAAYPSAAPPPAPVRALDPHADDRSRSRPRVDLRHLSAFEQAVLRKASEIPRGEVRPYSWIAREIGRPGAVRAVGSALGRNPVPLAVPCHRVVRSDGRVGDYIFGSDAKRSLLVAEGATPEEIQRLAQSGVRFHGSDTTRIFCFPTCHNARRTTDRHRVSFPSAAAATAAGYRPCLVCRPAQAS